MPTSKVATETHTVPLTANGRTEYFTPAHAEATLAVKDSQWKKVEPEGGKSKAAPAPAPADKTDK